MSIDTATKRASSLLDPGQLVYPPDGTWSADERGFGLEFYTGVSLVPVLTPNRFIYLSGSVAASPSLAGKLKAPSVLSGSVAASPSFAGRLTGSIRLSGKVTSTIPIEANV